MNIEAGNKLTKNSLPQYLLNTQHLLQDSKPVFDPSLAEAEREVIIQKLKHYGNSYNGKQEAAKDLGISTRTLYQKMDKIQIHS